MPEPARLARLRFRAWHRGTRELDYITGGFFDRHHACWCEEDVAWFDDLLQQEDQDVLAWALGTVEPPARFAGKQLNAFRRLDYVEVTR